MSPWLFNMFKEGKMTQVSESVGENVAGLWDAWNNRVEG